MCNGHPCNETRSTFCALFPTLSDMTRDGISLTWEIYSTLHWQTLQVRPSTQLVPYNLPTQHQQTVCVLMHNILPVLSVLAHLALPITLLVRELGTLAVLILHVKQITHSLDYKLT